MIENLFIQNLVLVDRAEIQFGKGLNIITGETGSGKSAILSAIRLILGERADLAQIRHGTEIAIVEAKLSDCLIRRELHRSGKSRAFINDELVSLQELKERLSKQVHIVDQGSAFELGKSSLQEQFLDDFAGSSQLLSKLKTLKTNLNVQIDVLKALQLKRELPRIDFFKSELELILDTNWQEKEEEALNAEHHFLSHAQENQERIGSILAELSDGQRPLLPILKRFCKEPLPQEAVSRFVAAFAELEEASHVLTCHFSKLEPNPSRLLWVESRMGQIESLKKRLRCKSFEEVSVYLQKLKSDLSEAENIDNAILDAQKKIADTEELIQKISSELLRIRLKAAPLLTQVLLEELRFLNLPDAALLIEVKDSVRFYFSANRGNPPLPLDQVASGGELSRLLFALKTTVKSSSPVCFVFDEIDSNVGGTTASLLGQKLETLGQNFQLICVTHFVQMAKHARHHFKVFKTIEGEASFTKIEPLTTEQMKNEEYTRMLGLNEIKQTR